MADLNVIILSGNLTKDPELRHTPKGTPVCNVRIANNGFKRDEPALFIDLTVWGKDAEYMASRCERGTFIEVSGRLTCRTYTTKEGQERTVYEVNVKDLHVKRAAGENGGIKKPGGGRLAGHQRNRPIF